MAALVESAYRGEVSRAGWTTEADLLDGQRVDLEMVRESLSRADTVVLVDCDRGRIIGCCELRGIAASGPVPAAVAFGMFAVEPSLQAGGIGRELLGSAEDFAVAFFGAAVMEMCVIEQRSELVAWYRRRGYRATGEVRPFPYGDERFGRPLRDDLRFVVLSKRLDQESRTGQPQIIDR